PLMTNDEGLELADALAKYKYQPFVEKRHEQLKSGFGVSPVWLKSVGRIESLLWLYYVVELVQALIEREVRRQRGRGPVPRRASYLAGGARPAPTAALLSNALGGLRRHRLLDGQGQELRRFHDNLPAAGQEVLALLGVGDAPYGLT